MAFNDESRSWMGVFTTWMSFEIPIYQFLQNDIVMVWICTSGQHLYFVINYYHLLVEWSWTGPGSRFPHWELLDIQSDPYNLIFLDINLCYFGPFWKERVNCSVSEGGFIQHPPVNTYLMHSAGGKVEVCGACVPKSTFFQQSEDIYGKWAWAHLCSLVVFIKT